MNRAVGENGFSSIRIFMEIGVVVCLNLGIIGDILKMADNFVGQIMGVQKFMPVGNRMPGEDGIKDFCQLPFTVFRIIGRCVEKRGSSAMSGCPIALQNSLKRR